MPDIDIPSDTEKERQFLQLVRRVKACQLCPRMMNSARVIGPGCGPLNAPLMFIGEAPGRLGADVSHLPFHGDKAGHNFESLLNQVGLTRYDIFVTNAVLCNPKGDGGNNATPNLREQRNCQNHLREQLELLNPRIVVTLGGTALRAAAGLAPHNLTLRDDVRTAVPWNGRLLIPLYHPGQRALLHRSFANQLSDYQFVVETLTRMGKSAQTRRRGPTQRSSGRLTAVVQRILSKKKRLSYFALHKLLFLAETKYLEKTGERLTRAYIIRQKDGPYCVDLHPKRLPALVSGIEVASTRAGLILAAPAQGDFFDNRQETQVLSAVALEIIDGVIERYGEMSHSDLKRAAYLASPMRRILRRERSARENFFNAPLFP